MSLRSNTTVSFVTVTYKLFHLVIEEIIKFIKVNKNCKLFKL